MSRVLIYYCSIEELKSLPGVGVKVADNILEMRDARGDLELEDLGHVPYLSRLTPQLIKCLDFAPSEEGEGLGERRGSLDERHREGVRSVDQLVEEWEGDRTGPPTRNGEGLGTTKQSPIKRGKSYQLKQEGEWWQRSQSLERLEDEYSELESAFMERPTPGGYQGGSPPGQSKSPLVRKTLRDDFDLESSREEKDRAYMHESQNRDTDMGAGYAFPRGQDSLHNGVSSSQRGMSRRIIGET